MEFTDGGQKKQGNLIGGIFEWQGTKMGPFLEHVHDHEYDGEPMG